MSDRKYGPPTAEVELATFHECLESNANGCYDDCGREHIVDVDDKSFIHDHRGAKMRTAYHKEEE